MVSAKLMPHATTRTRTWPGPGSGSGASRTCNTSGPPGFVIQICLMPPVYPAARPEANISAIQRPEPAYGPALFKEVGATL
jgi:hypothetical protein